MNNEAIEAQLWLIPFRLAPMPPSCEKRFPVSVSALIR